MFNKTMLAADTGRLLVQRLIELRPRLAVECGSGWSTALMAPWCERLISLDNDRRYAAPYPCVRVCRFVKGFYDTDLPDGIEFVLIDGPLAKKYGRKGTFPALWPHLADVFEVWLDDTHRSHEQDCLEQWQSRYPIEVEHVDTVKGLAIIRRCA